MCPAGIEFDVGAGSERDSNAVYRSLNPLLHHSDLQLTMHKMGISLTLLLSLLF